MRFTEAQIVVLIGPPYSGKTEQGRALERSHHSQCFDCGEENRQRIERNSLYALKVKPYLDRGLLVPDQYINETFHYWVEPRISKRKLPDKVPLKVLVGYPRSIIQASYLLSQYLHCGIIVIPLAISKETARKRLTQRSKENAERGTSRSDDTPEKFEIRWREYKEKSFPVLKCLEDRALNDPNNRHFLWVLDPIQTDHLSKQEVAYEIQKILHLPPRQIFSPEGELLVTPQLERKVRSRVVV